jgi:glycosyltransferase involved in cell wall biosynthesis
MNLLICNQWFPPFSYGGVAQYNDYLSRGLVEKGHKVIVLSNLVSGSKEYDSQHDVNIFRIPMPSNLHLFSKIPILGKQDRFLRNLVYSQSVCKFLKTIINKHKIDLVEYAEINGEGFYHRKYLSKTPYIIRCHTPYYLLHKSYESGEIKFSCKMINWMEKRVIQSANAVTAPSNDLAKKIEEWCELDAGSVLKVPNIIDTSFFSPGKESKVNDNLTALFVGRLEPAKGIYVIANAIPDVIKKYKNVEFIFAGKPRKVSALEQFKAHLKDLGCIEYCDFKGEVSKNSLLDLYRQCDIFVNPSKIYESFSYTNAEAMACGKPVVTSDIGGMPETVGDMVGGLVFSNEDSGSLAKKISKLIEDEGLRVKLGRQARERSLIFSKERVIDELIDLYDNIEIYKN